MWPNILADSAMFTAKALLKLPKTSFRKKTLLSAVLASSALVKDVQFFSAFANVSKRICVNYCSDVKS